MVEFNKITVDSNLVVTPARFAALCFNDNKLVFKSKYSITDNKLNLFVNSTDTISIFSNNGIATTYEFSNVRLNAGNIVLPATDINNALVENLVQNKLLVFINGLLQNTSEYTVINDGNNLRINNSHTNNYNDLFDISVYSSTASFQRTTYTRAQLQALDNPELRSRNRFTLPITYEAKNTLLFVDGHKVPFNAIDILNDTKTDVQLNIPESLLDINLFEIIKFTDTSTTSINFATNSGYLTYGPKDDFGKKIPNTYDVIFKFAEQAKLAIDNLRAGFIIKEKNGFGEAIIVDDTFEGMEIKGLTVQPFPYANYTANSYYLEVPESKKIIEYLAEFDTKYTFLPEILGIFQRLLLDEVNDTIERLREARSINKVDSVHINKLINLLGFSINIKQLNKKQRQELLEELTEFYRIAGTRNSYNLINILQNNLKLISADQLFTPSGLRQRKNQTLYDYDISIAEEAGVPQGGSGYSQGDVLALEASGLIAKVLEIDNGDEEAPGAITGIELETSEGYKEINQSFTMQSVLNGAFTANSTPKLYDYIWNTSDAIGCLEGMVLYSGEKAYGIQIDEMLGDEIARFTRLTNKHNPDRDTKNINFSKLSLYRVIDNLSATIKSTPLYSSTSTYTELVYTNNVGGQEFTTPLLDPGVYFVEASGGSGAGGAADSTSGSEYDLPATNGSAGELKTATFTLTEASVITGKIGQGGGAVKARGHDGQPYNRVLGNGFSNGGLGELKKVTTTNVFGNTYRYGNIAGGQGGGSTGLRGPNGETILEARGGNGGSASGRYGETVKGGIGGGGGVTTGAGVAGGSRAYGGDFWSKNGNDGWIKIYKVPVKYELTVNGDTSRIGDGEKYNTIESIPGFTITAHKNDNLVTFTIEPETGTYGCNSTFNLKTLSDNVTAKLSIESTVNTWNYEVKLNADPTHIIAGSTFINQDSPLEDRFTFTATKDGATEGTWLPTQGSKKITLNNVPAYTRRGEGAIVSISSAPNTQKNEDRCYIDFYKKEELGAEPVLEFRSHTIEYGTITEGTPGSPEFWKVGNPDVEYGTITQDTPGSPNPTMIGNPDISYGKTSWTTEGDWVEWWKWEREKDWYPTNHVDLEMKLPPGVNFSEYVDTFIEQFYNLASAVVYIHQITESFYFGNDTTTSYNELVQTDENITGDAGVMLSPFGIVSTMPLLEYEATITSDPGLQYINPIGYNLNVTIKPKVQNATVKIFIESINAQGQIIQTVIPLTEADEWTTKIKYGTNIVYEVSAPGYITRREALTVTKHINKLVILKAVNPVEPKYCKLTLLTTPENANVTFTVDRVTTTKSHTIYAWSGNTIYYTVSYPGYITHSDSIILNDDTDLYIALKRYESDLIFAIMPTPSDATVVLTAEGYMQEGNSISVKANTQVNYTVYKSGYDTISSSIIIAQDLTLPVVLHRHESKDIDLRYISESITDIYNNDVISEGVTEIQDLGKI